MEDLVKPLKSKEIIGVLDQIQKTNYMIGVHQTHEETSMVKQFERQRDALIEELQILLAALHLRAQLLV